MDVTMHLATIVFDQTHVVSTGNAGWWVMVNCMVDGYGYVANYLFPYFLLGSLFPF